MPAKVPSADRDAWFRRSSATALLDTYFEGAFAELSGDTGNRLALSGLDCVQVSQHQEVACCRIAAAASSVAGGLGLQCLESNQVQEKVWQMQVDSYILDLQSDVGLYEKWSGS